MSDYNSLKNSALTNPTGNLDLGSATNRYGNIFLQGNLAIGNLVATETSLVSPKISSLTYAGDDTAANPTGAQTITINGSGFSSGAAVYVAGSLASSVTVVSSIQVTFSSPAKAAGNYALILVNADGGTATFIPGMQYSGVPSWSTSSGSLASVYETTSVSSTLSATSDSPVTYSVTSGALPTGVTLTSGSGVIAGTAPAQVSGSTTYNFTASAIDGENQDTPRNFSVTVNADAVTWSSPADNTTYSLSQNTAMESITLSAASAAGKTITYTANSLPTGLSISGSTIVGTPTVVASTSSIITATASGTSKTSTRTFNWTVSVASEPNFKSTTLLLQADDVANNAQNNTFVDSSTNALTITRTGNTTQGSFSPFSPTGWSAYFDGSGDYLTTTGFGLSTDFTVEFWNYLTARPSNGYYITTSSSLLMAAATDKVYVGQQGAWIMNPPNDSAVYPNALPPLNQWNHFAIVRASGTTRFYLNGIQVGNSTSMNGDWTASQTWGIGGESGGGNPINVPHYMSNFRVSNVARYSGTSTTVANFTLPTADFVSDGNTTFLTLQSNRFKDVSSSPKTITQGGDAKTQAFSPFAPTAAYSAAVHGGSMYFDGSGDYLVTSGSALDTGAGTSDFTMECWVYNNGYSGSQYGRGIFTFYPSAGYANSRIMFRLNNGGDQINVFVYISGTLHVNVTSTVLATPGAWTHLAFVRQSGTFKLYINGTIESSMTATGVSASLSTFDKFDIGRNQDGSLPDFNGYISNFRYVKGTAVYTGNFTLPTAPLTAIANTALLLASTNAGIVDASGRNDLETVGDAKISTAVKKYGTGSIYFDGTGDALFTRTNPALAFESGDFTVEFWVNFTSIANRQDLVWWVPDNDSLRGGISWRLSGDALCYYDAAVGGAINTAWLPTINTWYHIALSRSGSSTRLFIDGVAGTTYSTIRPYAASYRLYIGKDSASDSYPFTGYMDDFRITKGVARYTANFTAPTGTFKVR